MNDRPHIAPGCHPVETGRYNIPTNQINELGQDLLKWIKLRTPGGLITGRPRLGKTRAITYLAQQIPVHLGDEIPLCIVTCNSYRYATENAFYTDLLLDLGHAEEKGQASLKRDRICKLLVALGQTSNQRRVILIVDEAQNWDRLQYKWLMDIYNYLERHDITLTVFLVGQPELLAKKKSLIAQDMHQIVGRFMVHEHRFHGINTLDDLEVCLRSYDEESDYPADSGWSFTRYFFPEQFARGFRLANSTGDLWSTFEYANREAGLRSDVEIPMQYLATTVQFVLTTFGIQGENVRQVSRYHWKQAVLESGYITAEKILS